jgi:LuxR family maltose regulon positive regulatory protein
VSVPLLRTKLYIPPPRPGWVERPRLLERLNAGLYRRLTLVSAPAGFGKTTLLSEWAHSRTRSREREPASEMSPVSRFSWLSLDEGDNDPARFVAYLVAALQTVQADVGEAALAALQSSRPPPAEALLTALINEIAALPTPDGYEGRPYILVLDDYHLVTAQAVHERLTFLLDHLPPNLHLVVATRSDPPLPIARLRGQGQVTEVRQSDLRFTHDEAAAFLNTCVDLHLSAQDVAALEARTEGWIAGLQMAAVSMRGRGDVAAFIHAFTGSDRYILDYLVEEVLQHQPESIQTFLLQTSVLDRLSGPLCDAVLGREAAEGRTTREGDAAAAQLPGSLASAQEILEYLERNNLFVVPLDGERRWYRYHQLFAALLRYRLHRLRPDLAPLLHGRAGAWYEQDGLVSQAIDHALAAGELEWAAHLVEQAAEATMLRSEFATLLRWVEALPAEQVRAHPRLCIYQALALVLGGHPLDVAQSRVQEAVEADRECAVAGEVATFNALIAAYRGQKEQSAALSQQALDRLPEDSLFFRSFVAGFLGLAHLYSGDVEAAIRAFQEAVRVSEKTGNVNISVLARHHLGDLAALQGRSEQAKALYAQALEAALDDQGRRRPIAGIALIAQGRIESEQHDLDAAVRHLTEGIALVERWGEAGAISGYTGLARVRQAQGDERGALEAIQTAQRLAERFDAMQVDDISVALCRARLWIGQGNLEAVARWAEERGLADDLDLETLHREIRTTSSLYRVFEYATLAWLRIVQDRPQDALRVLGPLLQATEEGGWLMYGIEVLALQALALQARGDTTRALTALERALDLAAPGGFVRLFVEKGAPMAQLLYQAAARGIAAQFAGRLLAAFPASQAPEPFRETPAEMIEPLSERETEVLQLVAAGLSNREIAQRLFLSVSTIKVHTYNIYSKLGVHSRTQAVAKARALGVLPSSL